MAVSNCPDCGQPVSDAGTACVQCGRVQNLVEALPAANAGVLAPVSYQPAGSVLFGTSLFPAVEGSEGRYPWFPVDPVKFGVMTVCTLGFYKYYWCYKSWQRIVETTGEDLSPFWRTVFAGLWNFSLYSRVEEACQKRGIPVGWSPVWLGIAYLLLAATWRLPQPYALLVYLSLLPFLPVVVSVARLNTSCRDGVTESPNLSYSGANIAGIVIGSILMLLVLIGSLTPAKH